MKCSKATWVLTYFMLGFPLCYPIFSFLAFQVDGRGALNMILSPLFWIMSFLWIMTGIGVRTLKPWSWYTMIFAQIMSAYFSATMILNYSQTHLKFLSFLLVTLVQFLVYRWVKSDLQVPYLFPKIRWWESGLAGMDHIQVEVWDQKENTLYLPGQILDLNLKGAFLKTALDFEPLSPVRVRFKELELGFELEGQVVWNAKSTVTHPKGIGIQFVNLYKPQRKRLKMIVERFQQKKNASR